MSADNGIYVLRTRSALSATHASEWRVAHMTAIDNIAWDGIMCRETDDQDIQIVNAREMFAGAPVFTNETSAWQEAHRQYDEIMASDFPIVEYGVSEIHIDREF